MHIGMIGLGKMGLGLVTRLVKAGHSCAAFDYVADARQAADAAGVTTYPSLPELVSGLPAPRTVWLMVPHQNVDEVIGELRQLLDEGDTIIDGGNSHYKDTLRRALLLEEDGLHFIDVGTSGGVAGQKLGYCLMAGGDKSVVERHHPLFSALAGDEPAKPGGQTGGFLYCGGNGAGHFVKMVHNGIEYGLMAAYAEGFGLLHAVGELNSDDISSGSQPVLEASPGDVAELWQNGSIVRSLLLDLAAEGYRRDPELSMSSDKVSDSGEGRWALQAATELGVPANVLAGALFDRFRSQGKASHGDRLQSAMRYLFGGHED